MLQQLSETFTGEAIRRPAVLYSLLLRRSKQNTKGYCVFYMSNALTCSGKVHVKRMGSDSTRFMAMAAEIMLFFPPKAL